LSIARSALIGSVGLVRQAIGLAIGPLPSFERVGQSA
jgi:hypothetical protein